MAVAEKMGARYMECSSKDRIGVDEIFAMAIDIVVANDRSNQRTADQDGGTNSYGVVMKKKKKRSCRIL